MIHDWDGLCTQERGFEPEVERPETDLSLVGASNFPVIHANDDEKAVDWYKFSSCV